MGSAPSKSYSLEEHPQFAELLATPFTVLRNPNAEHALPWEQHGWRISATMHSNVCNAAPWEFAKFAKSRDGAMVWKVVMNNAMDSVVTHACGWRRVGTFWPTDIPEDDRAAWCETFKAQLDTLSAKAELLDSAAAMSILK
jgi:hypothetical protein